MRILVIGSGGREHALCWKIKQSEKLERLFCAPGNAGISEVAEIVPISANSVNELAAFAEKEKIDLTVVGPEIPLVAGIVDEFERRGLPIFGPNKRASILEGSKSYTKNFAAKYQIPTANYAVFSDFSRAKNYLKNQKYPLVVKADGLAAGKGVIICQNKGDAESAIEAMLKKKEFKDAGLTVVIEEFLAGEEASFIALSDGENILPLASSQDHKAVYDGDQGPNTGGMGAYSPAPVVSEEMSRKIIGEIIEPTIAGMKSEGRKFKGFLYAGVMISDGKPYLLEYNVRCGDPETQPLMIRMKSDIIPLLMASIEGRLNEVQAEWHDMAAVCVVMASHGYPGNYEKGLEITGLDVVDQMQDVAVFHAGTKKDEEGRYLTAGGRVLSVTGLGGTVRSAIEKAYEAVDKIKWDGVHFRKDIGKKALKY